MVCTSLAECLIIADSRAKSYGILPWRSASTGTSFCVALRVSPCESTSENVPCTRSKTATSAALLKAFDETASWRVAGRTLELSDATPMVRSRWTVTAIESGGQP